MSTVTAPVGIEGMGDWSIVATVGTTVFRTAARRLCVPKIRFCDIGTR
jgi:hypothetical protein